MDFLPIVILMDYVIMLICLSLGTFGFGYILYWRFTHKSQEMSYCMLLYICVEFAFSLSSLPHIIYLTAFWALSDVSYNAYWIYMTALPQTVLLLILPLSVFFLGLDRCLCLLLPYKNRAFISRSVFAVALIVISIFSTINIVFYILPAFPMTTLTNCRSSGCLASMESAKVFSTMRYCASVSNVFVGLVLLKLVRKKIISKNALTKVGVERLKPKFRNFNIFQKNNRLAVVTLLMAILLDFLPHLINFSLNTVSHSLQF